MTGPNTPKTSLDEWWEGEIDSIIKEVNNQVSDKLEEEISI